MRSLLPHWLGWLLLPGIVLGSSPAADWIQERHGAREETGRLELHNESGQFSWSYRLTVSETGRRLLLSEASTPDLIRWAIWNDGDRIVAWDGEGERFGPVSDWPTALDLAVGAGAGPTFGWWLGDSPEGEVFEAIAEEGGAPCAATLCRRWLGTRDGGTLRTEAWVLDGHPRLQRAVTELDPPAAVIARAMGDRPTSPPTRGELTVLEHRPVESSTAVGFDPPRGVHYVETWRDPDDRTPLDGQFGETIEVEISSFVARVVDSHGEPIRGLTPESFRVRLGRQEAKVLSVDWIDLSTYRVPTASRPNRRDRVPTIEARRNTPPLNLFFVQAGLDSSYTRGAMRFQEVVDELLTSLPPTSLSAVVAYDSRLRLRQDFTDDRERILEALDRSIRFGGLGTERRQPEPSMATALDFEAARKAGDPEDGLRVAAEALARFPGEKNLIYLGWGLGRFGRGGVRMTPDYEPARQALRAANATVFVLDTTDADYHSLEKGLKQVAYDTGGTYEKTNQFPRRAAQRLGRILSGYYVLTVDRSGLETGRREWRIDVPGHDAMVFVDPTPE